MLLRAEGAGVVAVTQPAHAWLAGELAQAWGNARFPTPAAHSAVTCAAALHDIGWSSWEEAPDFDPRTGLPRVFADVPAEEHTRLWQHGIAQAGQYGPYVALLVSMHGDTIYAKTFDPATARPEARAAVAVFREHQRAFQDETIARLRRDPVWAEAVSEAALLHARRLIAAVDTLSLNLCWGVDDALVLDDCPTGSGEVATIAVRPGGDGSVLLDPWPFAVPALTLGVTGRRLAGRFRDAAAMAAALAGAEAATLVCRLRPAGDPAR